MEGGPDRLAVAYEAGPCGYDLLRLLGRRGVACDVIAAADPEQEGLRDPVRCLDHVRRARAASAGSTRSRGCAASAASLSGPRSG